jgi:hypothetical protein
MGLARDIGGKKGIVSCCEGCPGAFGGGFLGCLGRPFRLVRLPWLGRPGAVSFLETIPLKQALVKRCRLCDFLNKLVRVAVVLPVRDIFQKEVVVNLEIRFVIEPRHRATLLLRIVSENQSTNYLRRKGGSLPE